MKACVPVVFGVVMLAWFLSATHLMGQNAPRPHPTLHIRTDGVTKLAGWVNFQNDFKSEPQCRGITLYTSDKAPATDFRVEMFQRDGSWYWFLGHGKDVGGMGDQVKDKDAVRDVCLTIWDDVHAPYPVNPGGTVVN